MDFLAIIFSWQTVDSAVRLSAPLLIAALAGLYSERSGIFDIGLEGKMLVGAFAAGAVAAITGSAWLGLGAAILVSVVFALVHGFASITQRGNQIVSGVAINFLAVRADRISRPGLVRRRRAHAAAREQRALHGHQSSRRGRDQRHPDPRAALCRRRLRP